MADVHYQIVEHDGGWAYKVGDVFSETFRTHDVALAAAKDAAARQALAGESEGITYHSAAGVWLVVVADGGARPEADVLDEGGETRG